jgi:hypothetical protein
LWQDNYKTFCGHPLRLMTLIKINSNIQFFNNTKLTGTNTKLIQKGFFCFNASNINIYISDKDSKIEWEFYLKDLIYTSLVIAEVEWEYIFNTPITPKIVFDCEQNNCTYKVTVYDCWHISSRELSHGKKLICGKERQQD